MERPRETKSRDLAEPAVRVRAAAVVLFAGLIVIALLYTPLSAIDDSVASLHYHIRGSVQPDTNIVVVYIDDAAVRVMGWPLRRNFQALLISALTDLKVRAVGIELMFEDPRPEFQEYDDLLARVISAAPPTVLTSYFDSLSVFHPTTGNATAQNGSEFSFPSVDDPCLRGGGFHSPLDIFNKAASRIGHVNFEDRGAVPLFILGENGIVPAFGFELVRAFSGADRATVQSDGGEVSMKMWGRRYRWALTNGEARLNYPGSLRSFTAYPFLEVLRAYDSARRDLPTAFPVSRLRGKIVLVGVAAEGRGVVYDTPVDPRLPAIAMHATLVDNLLQSRLLRSEGMALGLLICLVTGVLCGGALLFLHSPWDKIGPAVVFVLLFVVSYLLFVWSAILIPLVQPTLAGAVAIVAAGVTRHRAIRRKLEAMSAEKETVLSALHDREARLAMLERQLLDAQVDRSSEQGHDLLEEIKKYKAEIRALSSRADDMEPSTPVVAADAVRKFEGIVFHGDGPMGDIVDFVKKIASSDASVLVLGESGTGKELIARAIHNCSERRGGAFIAVNCGALTETLLESELFGHEKGAFTGAVKEKPGRFELADNGTIFLDEIGEVSEGFQLKLLRVLQEGELERVGGTKTMKVNVRVVAATNKDLKERVKTRMFRDDLYYRLNVLTISVPPLRDRRDDIQLLALHFLEREGGDLRVSRNVTEVLLEYAWPGNVRELESTVRRGALLARADKRSMLTMKDLPDELARAASSKVPVQDQVLEMIRELGFSRSAVTETAAALGGLNRGTVAEYLRGESLKIFVDQQYDLDHAVKHLSLSTDPSVNERVRKRYIEYLTNIVEGVDASLPWDAARGVLKTKSRNLPQQYHIYLEQCAEAHFRGIWRLPS
jgi:transcriptional regulator with GAF, ATPase, and Fis domain/CHASE2 domain-containing sensor protein